MTTRVKASILQDFDAAVRRTLDSSFENGRENIKRLVHLIRNSPELSDLVAAAPHPPQLTGIQLGNLLYQDQLRLPPDPNEELGVVANLLFTIADHDDVPMAQYVWVGDPKSSNRVALFMNRYVAGAMEYLRELLSREVASRDQRETVLTGTPLEPEQRELLATLIEASRSVPRESRQQFRWKRSQVYPGQRTGASIMHPGLPGQELEVLDDDMGVLARSGFMVVGSSSKAIINFGLSPYAYSYYEAMRKAQVEPLMEIEHSVLSYLDTAGFSKRHTRAYGRWLTAKSKLSGEKWEAELTEIGHACREAMQFFLEDVAGRMNLEIDPDPQHTKNRAKAVLEHCKHLGKTEKPFLVALAQFWDESVNLVQRQEHGATREGEALLWEDARRAVFHTALVLYELDRAVERG